MRVEALLVHTEHKLGKKISASPPGEQCAPGVRARAGQAPVISVLPTPSAELTFPEIDLLETGQGALGPFPGVRACKGRWLFL